MYRVLIPKVVVNPTKLVDKTTGEVKQEQLVKIAHPDLFCEIAGKVLLDGKPYEPGIYEMAADSLAAGEYGRPSFRLKIGKLLQKAA